MLPNLLIGFPGPRLVDDVDVVDVVVEYCSAADHRINNNLKIANNQLLRTTFYNS